MVSASKPIGDLSVNIKMLKEKKSKTEKKNITIKFYIFSTDKGPNSSSN